MQTTTNASTERFTFLAEALNGTGGFAPSVLHTVDAGGLSKPWAVTSKCHLIPYPRENGLKFAARAATAVYENHLRAACERFCGYISKRAPLREGLENPLVKTIVQDADWANNHIDIFWHSFMIEAKARGSMLLLIELPAEQGDTMADTITRRLVPYLTAIEPERVTGFELNERKRFKWVKISACTMINGKETPVDRYWDAHEWRIMQGERVLETGTHPFGECPVLAFTESGAYPHIGNFAQIADISRRIYNATSERDEILRGQTFSVLAYQIPSERASAFSAADIAANIGVHNMLIHEGDTPAFIAPSDGPANVYAQAIESLQGSIRRISFAMDQGDRVSNAAESGVAIAIRFQGLNAALGTFAQHMQDLELRMWELISRYMALQAPPSVQWASDYAITDIERELTILAAMQATGFPAQALVEQRKRIAGQAFDSLDEEDLAEVLDAIEQAQQEAPNPLEPNDNTGTETTGQEAGDGTETDQTQQKAS